MEGARVHARLVQRQVLKADQFAGEMSKRLGFKKMHPRAHAVGQRGVRRIAAVSGKPLVQPRQPQSRGLNRAREVSDDGSDGRVSNFIDR